MDYMLLAGGRTELHYCQYHDMSLGGRRLFAACGVPPDYHPHYHYHFYYAFGVWTTSQNL
jgi:hypothetical protein